MSEERGAAPAGARGGVTVAAQLQELLDRIAIGELTARYNETFDAGELDAFAETFVADGQLEQGGRVYAGHAQLLAFATAMADGTTVHVTADAIVELDGDRARQRCTLVLSLRKPDRSRVMLLTTGRYRDELVRTLAGWRFASRVVELDRALPG